jgi:hypothetical protein
MVQSRETFVVKNDEDPKPRDFITLKFRVKFTQVLQVYRNQNLKFDFFISRYVIVEIKIKMKNDDELRVLLILKFRVRITLVFKVLINYLLILRNFSFQRLV